MASQKFLVDLDLQGHKLKDVVLGSVAGSENGSIWFDALTGSVKFIDGNGSTKTVAPESFVAAAVADEAADRASEITRIEGLVSAEEAARILAISGLAADLSDETSARIAGDNALASDIADEATARQNAISNLEGDLNQEITDRAAADLNLASDIATETSARQAADSDLQDAIDAVAADLAALDLTYATDASVASAVAAEETRALAAESAIASDLADEITNRQAAVSAVAGDLADEVTNRQAAVSAVANDLADEVSARQTAVQGVANDLADEVTRATAAENAIASDLSDEVTRATAAENAIASDLSDEVSRAQSAESSLDLRIDDLEAAAPTYALAASVAADFVTEAARADAYADAAAAAAQAAAEAHADLIAQGLNAKEGVRTVVGTGSTLSGTYTVYSPGDTNQDFGVALAVGDHVIVTDPDGSVSGGIYTVQSGAWTLREDWDNDTTKAGSFVYVAEGFYGGTAFVSLDIANNPSSPVWFFQQISGVANVFSSDETVTTGGAMANDLAVNWAKLVELYSATGKATATIGNGADTAYTISHSLGADVVVSVREAATGAMVQAAVVCSSGSVTITFNEAPANNEMKVVIIG